MVAPEVRVARSVDLSHESRAEIRALLTDAFDGDFSDDDWKHALGGWHVVATDGAVLAHAAVVARALDVDGRSFRAGYVDGVATTPLRQGEGLGAMVMRRVGELLEAEFELGALSTDRHAFYQCFGWERWHGPTFVRDGHDIVRSADEDDGIDIGYRQFGRGSDLVVITGDTAPMSLWGTTFPQMLAQHFRVTLFDNRGVGYSTDDTSKPMRIQLLADDTAALIGALGLHRPDVFGWSIGGEIGLTMSVRHPDALRRLVTTGGDTGGRQAIQPTQQIIDELNDPNTPPEVFLDLIFPATAGAARAAFSDQYISIPQEPVSAETLTRQGDAEAKFSTYEGTWKGLAKGSTPMLVTNGGQDVVVPPANADGIVKRIGRDRAEKVIFDDAGHGNWFQDMDRFVNLVVGYLRPAQR